MARIELPSAPKILVVALRRLGDVLLTTPLIRSLRRAWPDASIDALVFADTADILDGNPDLNDIITVSPQRGVAESLGLAAWLWSRYALAISTQSGDRPTLLAWIAGRQRLGPIGQGWQGALRRLLLDHSIPQGQGIHRVEEVLRLANVIGVTAVPEVVGPHGVLPSFLRGRQLAVIHAAPKFRYKQWHGWRTLASALADRGLTVVATGGASAVERAYLDDVWRDAPVVRLDGRLTWTEIAGCVAEARIYIGPDTSVTHLAAACGCPTVALFGPTDPRLWGPWPLGGLTEPWLAAGRIQRRGNVWLVQEPLPCLPCQKEGCERHIGSFSTCLDQLSADQVLQAVSEALHGDDRLDAVGSAGVQRPLKIT
jgi:heptosyltransferase III